MPIAVTFWSGQVPGAGTRGALLSAQTQPRSQLPQAFLPENVCHLVHTQPCGSRKCAPSLWRSLRPPLKLEVFWISLEEASGLGMASPSHIHPICLLSLSVPMQGTTSQSHASARFELAGLYLKALKLRLQQSHLTPAMLQQKQAACIPRCWQMWAEKPPRVGPKGHIINKWLLSLRVPLQGAQCMVRFHLEG